MRRIGVLMGWSESDPQFRSWIDTFVEGLAAASWMGTVELAIVAAVGLGLWLRALSSPSASDLRAVDQAVHAVFDVREWRDLQLEKGQRRSHGETSRARIFGVA